MAYKFLLPLASLITAAVASHPNGISAGSWGPQRIDVLGRDHNDNVFHKYYTAFGWGPDDPKHGNLEIFTGAKAISPISAASWGPNRLDFAFVDSSNNLKHKYWDGSSWGPGDMGGFDTLGKAVSGHGLSVTSWGPDRFDIIGLSTYGSCVHKAWTGHDYFPAGTEMEDLGGTFVTAPVSVSWGKNRLDVFGVSLIGEVVHKYWDGSRWQPDGPLWENLGGIRLSDSLTATSPSEGRFDIWAVSKTTNHLVHLAFDGSRYTAWEDLGGNFTEAPAVVHWSPTRVDILGRRHKSHVYDYKYWDGHQWSDWAQKGDSEWYSEPALVSVGENNLNIFGIDADGKVRLQVWDGAQWLPSFDGWFEVGDASASEVSSVESSDESVLEKVFRGIAGRIRVELMV